MFTTLLHLSTAAADWYKRRNAIQELSRLNDATLRDIGLVRADIPRVVAEAVSAARAAQTKRNESRVRLPGQESHELC